MSGIIVGVDGSANARNALEWAVSEAALTHQPLTVITVHESPAGFWAGRSETAPADDSRLATARTAATELVNAAVTEAGGPGAVQATVSAISGSAATELIKASKDADMVVLGARGGAQGSGLAGHTPIGSVSNKVLHHASCPVVVVPASS